MIDSCFPNQITDPWGETLPTQLSNLLAQRFIARPDVKAIQYSNGNYAPHTDKEDNRLPWTRQDIEAHLSGEHTYGHYLLSKESYCKFFAFDIDLAKSGVIPTEPEPDAASAEDADYQSWEQNCFTEEPDLRSAWTNRGHPARPWIKKQFKLIAHQFVNFIWKELELPCAVAYTGNKGIHVYAFTGLAPAEQVREGAIIALETIGGFETFRGQSFYRVKDSLTNPFSIFTIEVFPKQTSLDGKDLGNLMRLPLGRNLKSPKDPTFFVDMTTAISDFSPLNPEWALGSGALNPWLRESEVL